MSTSDAPVVICYDQSAGARHAIEYAAALFPAKHAVVLNIWNLPLELAFLGLGTVAAYGEESQKKLAAKVAAEGCEIAAEAGLVARPLTASGGLDGTCRTILRVADEQDACVIVMGSRGLGGARALFLGSVSHGVVHHAHRPVLIVPSSSEVAPAVETAIVDSQVAARP